MMMRAPLHPKGQLGIFGSAGSNTTLTRPCASSGNASRRGTTAVPALRTSNRILERRGAFEARHRVRHRPPPRGWYLPDVGNASAELEQFDVVSGLLMQGGPAVEVLTGLSLHGGLVASWPRLGITAQVVREALAEHWRAWGWPTSAQFDHDTRFQGPPQHPDAIGAVIRRCLSLAVVPVFAPPRERGFQAASERDNSRWQAKVWARFPHAALQGLQAPSSPYGLACHRRRAVRIEAAPPRRPFPGQWRLNLAARPHGRIVCLRRTTEQGHVHLLGHTVEVEALWPHRPIRCEVDREGEAIRFYALRRRDPQWQPLLSEVPYRLPGKQLKE